MMAFLIVLVLTANGWGYLPVVSFPDKATCEKAKTKILAADPAGRHAIRYKALCITSGAKSTQV